MCKSSFLPGTPCTLNLQYRHITVYVHYSIIIAVYMLVLFSTIVYTYWYIAHDSLLSAFFVPPSALCSVFSSHERKSMGSPETTTQDHIILPHTDTSTVGRHGVHTLPSPCTVTHTHTPCSVILNLFLLVEATACSIS